MGMKQLNSKRIVGWHGKIIRPNECHRMSFAEIFKNWATGEMAKSGIREQTSIERIKFLRNGKKMWGVERVDRILRTRAHEIARTRVLYCRRRMRMLCSQFFFVPLSSTEDSIRRINE